MAKSIDIGVAESIRLQLDRELEIGSAEVGNAVSIAEDQVENLLFLHPMAFADGSLSIRSAITFRSKLPSGRTGALFQIDIGNEGFNAFNLSDHLPTRTDAATASSAYISVPMFDEVLYVGGTDSAFLLSRGANPVVRKVEIEQRVGDAPKARLRPSRYAHPVSTDGSVAMPLEDAAHAKYLAVLTVDQAGLTARWSAFADDAVRPIVIDRKSPPAMLLASELPQLVSTDFAQSQEAPYCSPLIYEALVHEGRIFVYTQGYSNSPKHGDPYGAIAEIGASGGVKALPFMLDFSSIGDGKKRGLIGRFTSSGRYCLLSPVYKAFDIWKGRQKLFDMERGKLVNIVLPRGYTKYDILDHAGGHFWAELRDPGKPHRLARLRLA